MSQLDPEQEELLARMIEGARDVARSEQEWFFTRLDHAALLAGPGMGHAEVPEGDVLMLARAGLIHATGYNNRGEPSIFIVTPEGRAYYAATKGSEPTERQETELRRFLDDEAFRAEYPAAYAKWAEADSYLWKAESDRELTTVGHKAREALQEFATEAVQRYAPPDIETDPARVNRRLGAIIAMFRPTLGQKKAELLTALGDYSEATLGIVQRQEHGAQMEGEGLTWQDARRVVFHVASVMYEFAAQFREAASAG